ncbi:MAG: hypothetical protein JWM53_5866 [bacterium]|nr:hypothetical protein [bacterium]
MIRWLLQQFRRVSADPALLDHVPVTSAPDWRKQRLDEARQRYGKPFAPEIKTARVTEPSHILRHITRQAEDAKRLQRTNVSPIKQRTQKS